MEEDQIKKAFNKVKEDMINLQNQFLEISNEILEIKQTINLIQNNLTTTIPNRIPLKSNRNNELGTTVGIPLTSTIRQINSTNSVTSTDNTTVPQEVGGLKTQNLGFSIGNQGVSTDRQTDTSTDNSTHNLPEIPTKTIESNIKEASEILDSLDHIKKQIRLKFKRITPQEMSVFSTIYRLEEQNPGQNTYNQIAKILHLSQSSIRDYVQRMINKGIPIKKHRINNKKILLSISSELRKIASLSTITHLREL